MYVVMLLWRVQVIYSGDVQFVDLTHVCGNEGGEGVGYLQRRCPV